MEEMFVQEFNPDSKDWKNLDAFISKLNNDIAKIIDVKKSNKKYVYL